MMPLESRSAAPAAPAAPAVPRRTPTNVGAPPIHHQRRANAWLTACRQAVLAAGLRGPGVAASFDVLDALRSPINLQNGAALAALADARAPQEAVSWQARRSALHTRLYLARALVRQRVGDLRTRAQLIGAARSAASGHAARARAEILAVPRLPGQLFDQFPVARELGERGVHVHFAVPTPELAKLVASAGFPATRLDHAARGAAPGLVAQHRYVAAIRAILARVTPEGFSGAELTALRATTLRELRVQLDGLLRAATGLAHLYQAMAPRLVLPGNSYTMEGRTAAVLARVHGIRSAALEHGSIFPDDPIWQECMVDLVCAWGEPSRRALLGCGVNDATIAITGAPKLDSIVAKAKEERPPTLLVATSGPGDQVSAATHARFIEWLYEAADATPDIKWVVKLHGKDPPALYAPSAARFPNARVEVIPPDRARFGADIFEYLRGARALVTVCSTAAVEAMVVGVPVITVAPGPLPERIEFIDRGCTRAADSAAALAREARRAWDTGAHGEASRGDARASDEAARVFAVESYAHLGRAAAETARVLEAALRRGGGEA